MPHTCCVALVLCLLGLLGGSALPGMALGQVGVVAPDSARPVVECLAPLRSGCDIPVAPGAARVPINVRIVRNGRPADSATVAFTTSHCCLEPAAGQQTRTNATGIASITWAGTVRDDSTATVRVYVWGQSAGSFRDSVIIRPRMEVAYQISPLADDKYVIWFRDDQIPEAIDFRITRTDGANISEAECNRLQVAFTPHLGGTAGPSPANAGYHGDDACVAGASWKLANSVGKQFLNARIVGGEGAVRADTNVTAISRHQPRFVAGFAGYVGAEEGEQTVQSVFGVDFPVFYEGVCAAGVCKRLRVVLGSSFANPKDDYYAGVVIIPLLFGTARESIPIQATANLANGGRPFVALTVDAGSLLQMALNSFIPK